MKVNFPLNSQSAHLNFLYLWILVNLRRVKSGENFRSCLSNNQFTLGNYSDLVTKIAGNTSSPNDGTFCCDNFISLNCSSLISDRNYNFTNYCPSDINLFANLLDGTTFGRCVKLKNSYFCVAYHSDLVYVRSWNLGSEILCGGRLDNNLITANETGESCDLSVSIENIAQAIVKGLSQNLSSKMASVCCFNNDCFSTTLVQAQDSTKWTLATSTNCPGYSLLCFLDNGGWTCTGGLGDVINLYPLGYIANGTYDYSNYSGGYSLLPVSNANITYIGDCNIQIKLPVFTPSSKLIIIVPTTIAATVAVGSVVGGLTYFMIQKMKKKDRELVESLMKKLIDEEELSEEETERVSGLFKTWFNESGDCAIIISKESKIIGSNSYCLWVIVSEPSFGKIEEIIRLMRVTRVSAIKQNWKKILEDFENKLKNSEYPAAEIHNHPYTHNLPSLLKNYENVTKFSWNLLSDDIPDNYIRLYDILRIERRKLFGLIKYHHVSIYLGDNQVAHVKKKDREGVRRGTWEEFLDGGKKIEVYHPFIPFKKPELIKEHIDIAIGAGYAAGEYNLRKENCEHFATLCVYGLGMSQQSRSINSIVKGSDYLLQAIEASNKAFEKLKSELTDRERVVLNEENQEIENYHQSLEPVIEVPVI